MNIVLAALKSSRVLLEAAPKDLDLRAIKEDLQAVSPLSDFAFA